MKEKIKEIFKCYLPGFILGVLSAVVVVVYAETYFPSNQVTYDNAESGMTSDNVQTAIDELYNTCFPPTAGDQILEDQPLEKDPYECRYFFTGANPNNYITFNNETAGWRIISVECDGRIKIMKQNSIGDRAWDTSGSYGFNNWTRPVTLNTYLNGTYYNGLNTAAQNQVVSSDFGVGPAIYNNNNLSEQVNDENSKKWNGNIALPTLSEYYRTNSNENCKTYTLYNNNFNTCKNTTWMFNNTHWWTLTPFNIGDYMIYLVNSNTNHTTMSNANAFYNVRPALYLSSDVQITGGNGTQNNPYTIK